MNEITKRVYKNDGNAAVIELVDRQDVAVLDVGCGAGDNAALLCARDPHKSIFGITASEAEAAAARRHMEACWVGDIEREWPSEACERLYDVLLFSHVLEHTRDPERVLARGVELLRPGGHCVIAVPNVLHWRQRWEFVRGRFEYQSGGTMDSTHLRFYSYETAATALLAQAPDLRVVKAAAPGSVPLGPLRHRWLSPASRLRIDAWGSRRWPNLFGGQVLIKARKGRSTSWAAR
jgi:2-polyprenyl-3-methyl-5-hydroxy-6-metoxy-1,4-benzoquinol methylase